MSDPRTLFIKFDLNRQGMTKEEAKVLIEKIGLSFTDYDDQIDNLRRYEDLVKSETEALKKQVKNLEKEINDLKSEYF